MKISICMATYNGSLFVAEQLESFAAQTLLPDELVISDDGSTDGTLPIVREFARTAPFPVIVMQNSYPRGIVGNFCSALEASTGDLIFLSDQDDVWFDRKLETVASWAETAPYTLMFMNDAEIVDEKLHSSGMTKLEQIDHASIDRRYFVMGCCAALRRDLLNMALPISTEYSSHDDWLAFFAQSLGLRDVRDVPLQYYRIHENNTSSFVVNTNRRVGRLFVLKHRVRKATDRAALRRQDTQEIQNSVALLDHTQSRIDSERGRLLYSEARRSHDALRERHDIRSKWLAIRIIRILRGALHGTYGRPLEPRLMLRDLVG